MTQGKKPSGLLCSHVTGVGCIAQLTVALLSAACVTRHAFTNESRADAFHEPSYKLATERTLAFFRKHLA